MKKKVISSPIRWAGSKKRLLNEMLEKMFVCNKKNYVECFLGSSVVLLNVINNNDELGYKHFYANDINSNIINFFKMLQTNPKVLINSIAKLFKEYNGLKLEEKSEMFYDIRKKYNSMKCSEKKTLYFFFLMKTGFNGVYRENNKGEYNVPYGKIERVNIDEDYLYTISTIIKNVEFFNLPFEDFLALMKERGILNDSFVYCDPPYLPDDKLVYQKQMLYTKDTFNHELLFDTIKKLRIKNAMISMSESAIADEIYKREPFAKKNVMDIIRVVNPKKLFNSKEIAYINYKINE